jgi:hypothetical protein
VILAINAIGDRVGRLPVAAGRAEKLKGSFAVRLAPFTSPLADQQTEQCNMLR